MMPVLRTVPLLLCLALPFAPPSAAAQRPARAVERVRLSRVLTAFLVDSGVQTRGLPWTTGNDLPIKWETPGPTPNPVEMERRQGLTHTRVGTFTGTVGDSAALVMSIGLTGTTLGLARVAITMLDLSVTLQNGKGFILHRGMVEQALKDAGFALQPLKCSREKEGASYGNLVDAVKAPGKTASGLWWYWDSPSQAPTLQLTILYRRADMSIVECAQ